MLAGTTPDSLHTIGRRHWKTFLPMWLLPVGMFSLIFVPAWSTHTELIFWFLILPALFISMYVADIPRRRGLATTLQTAFWAILIPFLIWVVIIFGLFGLGFALRAA